MLGEFKRNDAGFPIVEFEDRYNKKCKIQQSSLATESCIWLGIVDPDPQVMCREAHLVGLEPTSDVGWQPYPLPEEVLVHTTMHLTKTQVAGLVERLNSWLLTDGFETPALEVVRNGKTMEEHEQALAAMAVKFHDVAVVAERVLALEESASLPIDLLEALRKVVNHVPEVTKQVAP